MRENIRKFDGAAIPSIEGRVPHPCRAFVLEARVGYHKSQPRPCLCGCPVHAAPPSPERHKKCRKSAQKHPGNHLPTQTQSTTYEEFSAKTPPPPPLRGIVAIHSYDLRPSAATEMVFLTTCPEPLAPLSQQPDTIKSGSHPEGCPCHSMNIAAPHAATASRKFNTSPPSLRASVPNVREF